MRQPGCPAGEGDQGEFLVRVAVVIADGLRVPRLVDPDDARATLVDITGAGRALRAELHEAQNDHLAELLETLSREDEATLGLAMRVALPLMQRLTQQAALTKGASRR